jgi:hypothetical protein
MKILRTFLTVSSVLVLCGLSPAYASAPMVKTQPGFYRMMLGDFEITALNDGVVAYTVSRMLPTATAAQIKSGLSDNGLTDPVGVSYNAFLINTGSKLVLIDTGTGGKLAIRRTLPFETPCQPMSTTDIRSPKTSNNVPECSASRCACTSEGRCDRVPIMARHAIQAWATAIVPPQYFALLSLFRSWGQPA